MKPFSAWTTVQLFLFLFLINSCVSYLFLPAPRCTGFVSKSPMCIIPLCLHHGAREAVEDEALLAGWPLHGLVDDAHHQVIGHQLALQAQVTSHRSQVTSHKSQDIQEMSHAACLDRASMMPTTRSSDTSSPCRHPSQVNKAQVTSQQSTSHKSHVTRFHMPEAPPMHAELRERGKKGRRREAEDKSAAGPLTLSMASLALIPRGVLAATAARSMSPVARWHRQCSSLMMGDCVPFPHPGGPAVYHGTEETRHPRERPGMKGRPGSRG